MLTHGGTEMVVQRRKTFCGNWRHCRRSFVTFTGPTKCLRNTLVRGCRRCPARWSKLLPNGAYMWVCNHNSSWGPRLMVGRCQYFKSLSVFSV